MSLVFAENRCPPFSDLNFTGIYIVDEFAPSAWGETLSVGSRSSQSIVDADVFLYLRNYRKTWDKMGLSYEDLKVSNSYTFYETMTHEIGHLLGLSHNFAVSPSIMSYSDDRRFSIYDKAAIRALYPMIKSN